MTRCVQAGVAYFHKQWGGRTPKAGGRLLDGRTWDELPLPLPSMRSAGGGSNSAGSPTRRHLEE